jgi:RHH-type transcriptional regulator, proline utilization regulon repressor / proline dehydrogenase / delta 1-pyrroline-5-carboxylate dehydrogenase
MLFTKALSTQSTLRAIITKHYRADEDDVLLPLIKAAFMNDEEITAVQERAIALVTAIRQKRLGKGGIDAFMYQYHLSSEEGIALMCLAEALLRIPDTATQDKLIKDKLSEADWRESSGKSHSMFVNAATWGLMLTGKVYDWNELNTQNLWTSIKKFAARRGEPVIRQAVNYAMKIMGKQFVMGRTIQEALKRAEEQELQGYRFSYDMLGEAARTAPDAERYFKSYQEAIVAIGEKMQGKDYIESAGISIKLSALHPRYELAKVRDVMNELVPKLLALCVMAKSYNISLTVDAEEADRLDLSLDIIEKVFCSPELSGWNGFGLAVQAYQKRAFYVIDWLAALAKSQQKPIMIRLVKGAYWDAEIKVSQEQGFEDYPVFTRKVSTDVSYLACAKKIISYGEYFYPQFATHNAYTVSAVLEMIGTRRDFEFQCLHGMGDALYDEIVGENKFNIPCRVYAPVGTHEDLLAYLVRRLLENGANSSFVNRIIDANEPISKLVEDPVKKLLTFSKKRNPQIPLPADIYGEHRRNAMGVDLSNLSVLSALDVDLTNLSTAQYQAAPIIQGVMQTGENHAIISPANPLDTVGYVVFAEASHIEEAFVSAQKAYKLWHKEEVRKRAAILQKAATLLESNYPKFIGLLVREAGKTVPDAVAEIREAVDFCRYYAEQAVLVLDQPLTLTGPTGEFNALSLKGRGIIVCISPWNFPLAIFIGQITAALVAGNAVIAKPAEQTPLIAVQAVQLLHEAGIPKDVLQLLTGLGETVGAAMVNHPLTAGVMFTGSTQTAQFIHQSLANKKSAIIPFIAETGGQNAMIVDSSALPEQVVRDVVLSAFGSAGQRCSALRVLYLQEDIADKVITMLKGAMAELVIGYPALLATDIGPVIDKAAKEALDAHFVAMQKTAKLIYQCQLPTNLASDGYFPPCVVEIEHMSDLHQENFGPFLHIIRYKANALDKVIDDINASGYGLTLGVHSRIESTITSIIDNVHVGNIYVNRSMIGAVVGVQPFGGEGLSGTGPKAGGPYYLLRLCTECSLSVNTTASGGNASLMSLEEEYPCDH